MVLPSFVPSDEPMLLIPPGLLLHPRCEGLVPGLQSNCTEKEFSAVKSSQRTGKVPETKKQVACRTRMHDNEGVEPPHYVHYVEQQQKSLCEHQGVSKVLPRLLGRADSPTKTKQAPSIGPPPGLEFPPGDVEDTSSASGDGQSQCSSHEGSLPAWLSPQTAVINSSTTRRSALQARGSEALAILDGAGGKTKSRLAGLRSCGDHTRVAMSKPGRIKAAGASTTAKKAVAPWSHLPQYQPESLSPWPAMMAPMSAPGMVPLSVQNQVPFLARLGQESMEPCLDVPWPLLATAPQTSGHMPAPLAQDQRETEASVEFVDDAFEVTSRPISCLLSQFGIPMKVDVMNL